MNLKSLTVADLQKELARRERGSAKLLTKRARLVAEIAGLDKELSALGVAPDTTGKASGRGGAGASGRRTRAKNDMSLPDAIAATMEIRAQITPKEAAELVQQNGYVTNSKTFNVQVTNTLSKDPRFKRVERGVYERVK